MQRKDSMADLALFKAPSKKTIVVSAGAGVVFGLLVGALIGSQLGGSSSKGERKGRKAESAASASASASAAPVASGAPAAPETPAAPAGGLAARAASGDEAAKKSIEARPLAQRTADEVTALARARVEAQRKELAELARKIKLLPKIVKEDKEVAARLKELTRDREIATDTLRMFASLPGPTGPDLLYNVLSAGKKDDTTTQLAHDLLYAKDVRPNASLELSALLDLRKAEKCEEVAAALPAVKRDADRRAIIPLMRFENKRGCGDKGKEDCWKCLRDGDLLKDAQLAVQKRPAP